MEYKDKDKKPINIENKRDIKNHIFETINNILNSHDYSEILKEVIFNRGLEIVLYTEIYTLITENDLLSIKIEDRENAKKFIILNLENIKDRYSKKNNHSLNSIILRSFIPNLIDHWEKGERYIIQSNINLPLPIIPTITPNFEDKQNKTINLIDFIQTKNNQQNIEEKENLDKNKRDLLKVFVSNCSISENKISSTELYDIYKLWCVKMKYIKCTRPTLIEVMRKSTFKDREIVDGNRSKGWKISINRFLYYCYMTII